MEREIRFGCAGKQRYASYEEAAKRIKRTRRKSSGGGRIKGTQLLPYRCKYCHEWHIGNGVRLVGDGLSRDAH